jgi:D-alanine-D-alanine ligase-like ATP-grasp enzyme
VTVAAGEELSLDEKFQQGQGTNIELDQFLPAGVVDSLRRRVVDVARALGITGYSRVDAFYDRSDGSLWPIEANTLCGLTEATVFYTQALSSFGLSPPEALERIVEAGFARAASRASNRGVESGARSVES